MSKLIITLAVMFASLLSSQVMANTREYHAFGFAKTRASALYKESTDLCYSLTAMVKAFKTTDSTVLTKSNSNELKESINAALPSVLSFFEVPVRPCTKEKRDSLSTTMLRINVQVTQQKSDRELFKIEVHSDVGQVVRLRESNNYIRVNIRTANHVTLTRIQDEITQYIVDESKAQVEKAAVQFVEARQK